MKFLATALLISTTLIGASSASAGGRSDEWARVVSVDPIIENYSVPQGRDVCYTEPRTVYEPGYYREPRYHRNSGGTLAGAIVGGALGNLVGKGDGRKAATIAGAVIGGSIGHNSDRGYYEGGRYYGGRSYTTYDRVCDRRTDYREEREVVGYNVTYEYHGHTYHTRTDHHPGDRIRVEVSVNAIE